MRGVVLRGFDWAGMKLCLEVPEGIDPAADWELPEGFTPLAGEVFGEDVRVSITAGSGPAAVRDGTTWFHEGDVFEAGRIGDDHWLRLADDGRVAVADPGFRFVHVALPPASEATGFPLSHPLDDLILIHRALEQGAFALRATAAVRDGEALVVLGGPGGEAAPPDTSLWQGWLLLRPGRGGVRVAPLPSTRRAGDGQTCRMARLTGLHVIDPLGGEGDAIRVLDRDCAAGELLRYAFSSIASSESGDCLVETALRIARQVPMVHMMRPQAPVHDRFGWQADSAALRSVLPAGA